MARTSSLILTLVLVLCATGTALAAEDAPAPAAATEDGTENTAYIGDAALELMKADREIKQYRFPVSRRVSRYHEAAQELYDQDDFDGAQARLETLLERRMNLLEQAMTYRVLAFVGYGAGDPELAIANFKKVLELEVMKVKDETRIRFSIAQLYASLQSWKDVIYWLDEYRRYTPDPDPLAYYLKSIAYFQLNDEDAAIEQIGIATKLTADEPKEGWLRLQAALYTQKQDYDNALPVLEELMLRFPDKRYWIQVSLLYGAQEEYVRSLAVQQIAYAQGYLESSTELLRLARSYLFQELPYQAAKVLSDGLASGKIDREADNYAMLANSWIAAREYDKALGPLGTGAEVATDGNLYVRLGQVFMQREKWGEAAGHIEHAIEKGGLKSPGNAELLAGICYYNAGKSDLARRYFIRARTFEKERDQADKWLQHLDQEATAA